MKHADPRTLEARFTIGQVLALAWRACLACRWHILLLGVPTAIIAVGVRWLTYLYIEASIPAAWQKMVVLWQYVLVEGIAFVGVTFAAVCYMRGQSPGIRDVHRIPWRRLPIAVASGLILTCVTWWPEAAFDWTMDGNYAVIVPYAILTVNVLTFDVLTFILLPVLLIENGSLISAVRRSGRLVARHPWRILAIDIGFWCLYFLFREALAQVNSLTDPEWSKLVWSTMVAGWIVFSTAIACCLTAATYHLIRSEQEGPAPDSLARVFD